MLPWQPAEGESTMGINSGVYPGSAGSFTTVSVIDGEMSNLHLNVTIEYISLY